MFKHNWAWIKLATYNSTTVLTTHLRNPRDYAPLKMATTVYEREICVAVVVALTPKSRSGTASG